MASRTGYLKVRKECFYVYNISETINGTIEIHQGDITRSVVTAQWSVHWLCKGHKRYRRRGLLDAEADLSIGNVIIYYRRSHIDTMHGGFFKVTKYLAFVYV